MRRYDDLLGTQRALARAQCVWPAGVERLDARVLEHVRAVTVHRGGEAARVLDGMELKLVVEPDRPGDGVRQAGVGVVPPYGQARCARRLELLLDRLELVGAAAYVDGGPALEVAVDRLLGGKCGDVLDPCRARSGVDGGSLVVMARADGAEHRRLQRGQLRAGRAGHA